jgi:hypothetical protein
VGLQLNSLWGVTPLPVKAEIFSSPFKLLGLLVDNFDNPAELLAAF